MLPINIPNHLPAKQVLESEHIFVMDESRAFHQDIRPQKIVILNLMPKKIQTETQLLRLLGNSPLQVHFTFLIPSTHTPKIQQGSIWMNFIRNFPASATNGLTE